MGVFTEFGKLKEVIVGDVVGFNYSKLDKTFYSGYAGNLCKVKDLFDFNKFVDYEIDEEKINERKEDLDNLAKLLEELGLNVIRPIKLKQIKTFKTPYFIGVLTPATNPRDRVFVFGNNIIETPCMVRKRYFENYLFYDLFKEYLFEKGYNWIAAPYPPLKEENIDFERWENKRNFKNYHRKKYDISFDAAQILKIGKDLIFNVSTYNHMNGYYWFERLMKSLGYDVNIHLVYQLDDNHIDGKISVLKPGVFLVNNLFLNKDIKKYLPEKFKSWKVIYTAEEDYKLYLRKKGVKKNSDLYYKWQICSIRGSFTNVFSIDENTVLVLKESINTIKVLEKEGFNVIPVQLRHCELFGGGIHCATLDMEREDDFIEY